MNWTIHYLTKKTKQKNNKQTKKTYFDLQISATEKQKAKTDWTLISLSLYRYIYKTNQNKQNRPNFGQRMSVREQNTVGIKPLNKTVLNQTKQTKPPVLWPTDISSPIYIYMKQLRSEHPASQKLHLDVTHLWREFNYKQQMVSTAWVMTEANLNTAFTVYFQTG